MFSVGSITVHLFRFHTLKGMWKTGWEGTERLTKSHLGPRYTKIWYWNFQIHLQKSVKRLSSSCVSAWDNPTPYKDTTVKFKLISVRVVRDIKLLPTRHLFMWHLSKYTMLSTVKLLKGSVGLEARQLLRLFAPIDKLNLNIMLQNIERFTHPIRY